MIPEIDVIEDLTPETGVLIHDTILEIGETIPGVILETGEIHVGIKDQIVLHIGTEEMTRDLETDLQLVHLLLLP